MHCTACVSKIETALYLVEGVTKAVVKLDNNKAIVEGNVSSQELINAIHQSGYHASLIDKNSEVDPYKRDSKQNSTKLFPLYLIFYPLIIMLFQP